MSLKNNVVNIDTFSDKIFKLLLSSGSSKIFSKYSSMCYVQNIPYVEYSKYRIPWQFRYRIPYSCTFYSSVQKKMPNNVQHIFRIQYAFNVPYFQLKFFWQRIFWARYRILNFRIFRNTSLKIRLPFLWSTNE